MNPALLGVSALFYLALVSTFYVVVLGGVAAYRRFFAGRAPQSVIKRILLLALLFPPVAALLPTVAGVILRHMHGPSMVAPEHGMPGEAPTTIAHHTMACALLFERIGAMVSFGASSQIISLVLGIGTWLLLGWGLIYAARLTWATHRLETGISPLLAQPSSPLAESLERVGNRLGLSASFHSRFFECALPPDRSSVMGLQRAKCVLSREFIQTAPPEELDALVAHESGHLRSGDVYAAFAVGLLNCVFFFLRPVRIIGGWWREAAELAADDTAVRGTGNDPLAVASAILRVRGTTVRTFALPTPLLPFADESVLSAEKRIERLLAQAERAAPMARTETRFQVALTWGATGILALLGAGLLVSSETACVTHCTLELIQRVL
ncbi:MAG: M48 family metalloprotease [Fibrella sp.]|nr:M48 family metalloprotease [Armatimonadota bacterium]